MSINLPLRTDLAESSPYGAPEFDVAARLNVNENPYPPAPEVCASIAAAVAAAAAGANRYPERDFPELCQALVSYLRVESGVELDRDQLWAANGSNEIMLHLMQAFGGAGRTALSAGPTYSMYPEYARTTGTGFSLLPRNYDFTVDTVALGAAAREVNASLILLASPNNPTGTTLELTALAQLAHAVRSAGPNGSDCIVVVDEAYGEFRRPQCASALTLLQSCPNLVVTRTMSKAFAMAGLRLGYLAADPVVVEALRIVRLPYHLSALTQAAAIAALSHRDTLLAQVAQLRQAREELAQWLTNQGFAVFPSEANFLLFGRFPDRHEIWQGLTARGVLIREVGPDQYLRVSIGTETELTRFKASLLEVTRDGK